MVRREAYRASANVPSLRFETQDVEERAANLRPPGLRQRCDPRTQIFSADDADPFGLQHTRSRNSVGFS